MPCTPQSEPWRSATVPQEYNREGNLYTAGVNSGRFNKFTPRPGANPAYMVGKPVYSAWR